jgi:hypothetical protein
MYSINKFKDLELNENSIRTIYGGKILGTCSGEGFDLDTIDDDGCTHYQLFVDCGEGQSGEWQTTHSRCDTNGCN